ncbi:deoxyribose-phosphate aldolase [Floccifex sp.]|uniref:deoxyribose-phosphate aldolase n=1 Tax=Floccifex sp. TaxID=2815810 RepID=UPI002A7602D4|nr:deoxyribose-phosphate aldolase [Floccifex sp.]MDD7281595.1 deoxyribose-phosphate aldolase [Erysipelotrichaceae bacterium]MDY2957481.1 deoxyribose-phosphate aldolase [Floccifex sp.]
MKKKLTIEQCANLIDHTNVKAYVTKEDMKTLCEQAKQYHFAMVAINSGQTAFCHSLLQNSEIHTGAAIGFPLGQMSIQAKVLETQDAINNGADEIDYQLNITEVKDKNWTYVKDEMKQITDLAHKHGKICKVILETCYLTSDEIIKICEIAVEVRIDFVKTSTGFGSGGAKEENVRLMKSIVKNQVKVKASGGIRDAQTFKNMLACGAQRIGTSAGIQIIDELEKEAVDGCIEIEVEA